MPSTNGCEQLARSCGQSASFICGLVKWTSNFTVKTQREQFICDLKHYYSPRSVGGLRLNHLFFWNFSFLNLSAVRVNAEFAERSSRQPSIVTSFTKINFEWPHLCVSHMSPHLSTNTYTANTRSACVFRHWIYQSNKISRKISFHHFTFYSTKTSFRQNRNTITTDVVE